MVKHNNAMLNHMGKELRAMAIFEDVVGESEDYGAIPAHTKFFTAADTDFLLKKKVGCVSEIPAADEKNLGTVILLTDNQTGYNVMHFYKCIFNNGRYMWKDLNNGTILPVGNCTNIRGYLMDGGSTCAIKWNDPVVDDTVDQWDHTVLVKNYHHEPAGINDGVVVVTCSVRDQYASTPFLDSAVDTTKEHVYYKLIPVGVKGTENTGKANAFEPSAPTWDELHELIQAGVAPAFLPKGSQISVPHSVYGTLKFTVKGYEDLGAGSTDPTAKINIHDAAIRHCVVLMSAYILPELKQFDAAETQFDLTMDTEFQSGKTYYTKNGSSYTAATVTVGGTIPPDTYYEKNQAYYSYGTNRWDQSGLIQWLNSTGSAGTWWTKKHANDVKPDYADTEDGFLKGFTDSDFVKRIIDLDNVTKIVTPSDKVTVTTVDKIWLPSNEQVKDSGTWGFAAADRNLTKEGSSQPFKWWLRSATISRSTRNVDYSDTNGSLSYDSAKQEKGIVPCLAIA